MFCFFSQEELDLIDRDDEQKFLASADYLASNGMPSLISNMQSAVKEVLKGYITLQTYHQTLISGASNIDFWCVSLQEAAKGCVNHKSSSRNCDPDSRCVYEHWKPTSLGRLFNDGPRRNNASK